MDRAAVMTGDAIAAAAGSRRPSQVAGSVAMVVGQLFPLMIDERTDVDRIENFDPRRLPLFSRLEISTRQTTSLNPETLQLETAGERHSVLVQPFGYVLKVGQKLLETIEIAVRGMLIAILFCLPLALLGTRDLHFGRLSYLASRSVVALCRAIPELISALFLVLAYGFGSIAGVLALAIHSAGVLGKFYAEDIENADPKAPEPCPAAARAATV